MYNDISMWQDTIVAIATPQGMGAIAIIRVSGKNAISITNKLFPSKDLEIQKSHTVHVGYLKRNDEILDEVVITLYKNPKSYTGEDVIEISCHGSVFIQQNIINAFIENGARLANAGEFTQRAFLNGKKDLAQAEAVADVIAAENKAAQMTALKQMRGGFSDDLKILREQLINFAALIELELDFSDEDVEFADRNQFNDLIKNLKTKTKTLIDSFKLGNVIKNGVSVAIIGKPNAGKSTLLNALLNEERAIVSDIAGTTRDTIEESVHINGIKFRLIDTAGIREHSSDVIENLGIERSKQNAEKADIIIQLIDATDNDENEFSWLTQFENKTITVVNKTDIVQQPTTNNQQGLKISAKEKIGIEELQSAMYEKAVGDNNINTENTIVTNARHHAALQKLYDELIVVENGLQQGLSGDLLAMDIRQCLHYLGEITGQIEVDRDILGTIFGKFCIGK